ncbi:P-loop containing nucleoside triphosphate hydrolase protein [Xylaria digitata]|nr:P-loop containing nucleoside triphosphate hydrolase protein [Xylaria digitata]
MAERGYIGPGHKIPSSSIDGEHSAPSQASVQAGTIRILVVGITGSGKSTLISSSSGYNVGIGHDGDSCTQICKPYPAKYEIDGKKFELIDTPGFDDPKRNDFEVLRDITEFLDGVSGIIYCHRINETRLIMDSKLNLEIIKAMCGKRFHSRVVICSTMWDTLSENLTPQQLEKHQERMEQLLSTGFRGLMESGAKYMEFRAGQPNACLDILKSFSSQRFPPRMAILEQISQKRNVQETDSGKVIEEEHRRRAEEGKLQQPSSSRARDVEHKNAPRTQRRDNEYGGWGTRQNLLQKGMDYVWNRT